MKDNRGTALFFLVILGFMRTGSCNIQLEASRMKKVTRKVEVLKPGTVEDVPAEISWNVHSNTELRMHCLNVTANGFFTYGSVLDGECYRNAKEFVFIDRASIDFKRLKNISATNCVATTRCRTASTLYRCKEADIVCYGVKSGSCGPDYGEIVLRSCHGMVYSSDGDAGWMCTQGDVFPNRKNQKGHCRYIGARRKDIKNWTDFFLLATLDHFRAIFASAYALKSKEVVRIPDQLMC